LKLLKSQLRNRISSGGKSRVPLGGFTSIFLTSPVTGGVGDNAPDRPPLGESVSAAWESAQWNLTVEDLTLNGNGEEESWDVSERKIGLI